MRIKAEERVNKFCPKCNTEKSITEFGKDKRTSDGYYGLCFSCKRDCMKSYMNSHKGKSTFRKNHLRRTYGLTSEQYDTLLSNQNGKCAICKIDTNPARGTSVFTVDHCHNTGTIRGLLCTPCNALLGLAKDSIEILESASQYLKNYFLVP